MAAHMSRHLDEGLGHAEQAPASLMRQVHSRPAYGPEPGNGRVKLGAYTKNCVIHHRVQRTPQAGEKNKKTDQERRDRT